MVQTMEQFLTAFRKARGWSLKKMAEQLGYSSANSLVRLEQEKANLESLLRFAKMMHMSEAMHMTEEEGQALDHLLEKRQLTDDAYHATVLLHSLLRNEKQDELPPVIHFVKTGQMDDIMTYGASRHITSVIILNCLNIPVFEKLADYIRSSNVDIRHYMIADDLASHTVQRVLRVLPMTYLDNYHAYTMHEQPDQPSGMLRADMIFCQHERDGESWIDVMIANRGDCLDCHTIPGRMENVKRVVLPQIQEFRPFGDHRLHQARDYGEYLQMCFDMERDHEVMRIKPDFGMDQIPTDVLLSALLDQMEQQPEADQAMSGTVEDVVKLLNARYENYSTKHQPQYHVYKRLAMWHFVKTGQMSDHPWLLRPFTVQERLTLLQSTIQLLRANPYLHITFLKNEKAFRNEEIVYYEGVGVSIIKPETDYNLRGSHRESLVSQEKFMHVYRSFFLSSIMGMHTLSESQAMNELNEMVSYLQKQKK